MPVKGKEIFALLLRRLFVVAAGLAILIFSLVDFASTPLPSSYDELRFDTEQISTVKPLPSVIHFYYQAFGSFITFTHEFYLIRIQTITTHDHRIQKINETTSEHDQKSPIDYLPRRFQQEPYSV